MNNGEINEALFDALLKVAAKDASQREMDDMPSVDELDSLYKPSEAFNKNINSIIRKKYTKTNIKKALRNASRVVAGVAIVFTLVSALLFNIKATRNAIFNAFIEWKEKYIEIRFDDPEKLKQSAYKPSFLPDGFIEHSSNRIGNSLMVIYMNHEGTRIIFDQRPYDTGVDLVDNESSDYSEIDINGKTAFLFLAASEHEMNVLIWQCDEYVFQISSQIAPEEIVKIGQSVKK